MYTWRRGWSPPGGVTHPLIWFDYRVMRGASVIGENNPFPFPYFSPIVEIKSSYVWRDLWDFFCLWRVGCDYRDYTGAERVIRGGSGAMRFVLLRGATRCHHPLSLFAAGPIANPSTHSFHSSCMWVFNAFLISCYVFIMKYVLILHW